VRQAGVRRAVKAETEACVVGTQQTQKKHITLSPPSPLSLPSHSLWFVVPSASCAGVNGWTGVRFVRPKRGKLLPRESQPLPWVSSLPASSDKHRQQEGEQGDQDAPVPSQETGCCWRRVRRRYSQWRLSPSEKNQEEVRRNSVETTKDRLERDRTTMCPPEQKLSINAATRVARLWNPLCLCYRIFSALLLC
jgi:hypothetical protein